MASFSCAYCGRVQQVSTMTVMRSQTLYCSFHCAFRALDFEKKYSDEIINSGGIETDLMTWLRGQKQ